MGLMLVEELRVAIDAARIAGEEVVRLQRDGVRYGRKEGWELVSEADIRAAEILHETLTKAFPGDGWLSEEHTDTAHRLGRERVWIVDPIDGTREYLQGIPEYAISIGLAIGGRPVLGVVHTTRPRASSSRRNASPPSNALRPNRRASRSRCW